MPITTLLFDLDDTLLGNDINQFIQPYLTSFAEHMSLVTPPQNFLSGLLAGTQEMMANRDPRRTLQQRFAEQFYPKANAPASTLNLRIDSFYSEQFGRLRSETRLIPAARDAVQWALNSGLQVVVATNALFPRTAILQRLAWAGVSADEFPFALITTYEFMHFAKPLPEYYAETLAWLDRRPEEALMIGDDWSQDIVPAHQAGLRTFWVAADSAQAPANTAHPLGQGSLAQFLSWAKESLSAIEPLPASPRSVRAGQAGVLAVIVESVRGLPQVDWGRRPSPESWSLTEIMCHLRDGEVEVNLPRVKRILEEENPFLSAAAIDGWARERNYQTQSGPEALEAFVAAREEKLAILDRLSPDDWKRPARHAVFGPTTLQELVTFINEHDRLHLRQIRENVGKSQIPKSQTPML
jgi:FMN phosphatase YigB (HAD superfamily)